MALPPQTDSTLISLSAELLPNFPISFLGWIVLESYCYVHVQYEKD